MNERKFRAGQKTHLRESNVSVDYGSDIQFNSGSETFEHAFVKFCAGWVMHQNGWIVNSEVEIGEKEADLICWGNQGRQSWCIEVETSPVQETINDKVRNYVNLTNVDDIIVLNPGKCPSNMMDALEWVSNQLPAEI